jgi:Na+-transporting NADH:ubiquinone oxidoreductase subunit NqrC
LKTKEIETEWSLLQNQFDSYEKFSLLIKLANTGVLCTAYFVNRMSVFILFLLLILWMQDAIWKTFQSRIETRLLQLEGCLFDESDEKAFQFNSQYQKNRPESVGLISEYLKQALRPTVAFPHVVLVFMLAGVLFY